MLSWSDLETLRKARVIETMADTRQTPAGTI
jgi:hypothetical protein